MPPTARRRAGAWPIVLLLLAAAGIRADTVRVSLSGVDGQAADNVRALLPLARYGDSGELSELNIRNLHARAAEQIRQALRPFGYYDVSVESSLTREDEEKWLASYEIDTGQPVRLGEVRIVLRGAGADDAALGDLRESLPLTSGEVLQHARYEQAKSRLLETAFERGYRDAAYAQAVLAVNPGERRADVTLVLNTGPRYQFGELIIEQDVLDEDLLRRYATFEPGDPYSTRRLVDFEFRLFDSGYFSSVELEPLAPEGDRIPVRLVANPGPRRAWNLRAGYATDTGPRIGVGFESRRLNRKGHRGRANLELSTIRRELTGRYLVPLERPANDLRTFQFGVLDQELGDTRSTRYEAAVRETRRDGPWNRNRYLRFARERNTDADVPETSTLLIPGYTLVRSRSNDVTYPTRGSYVEVDVHGGLEPLLSATSFLQLRTDLRLIRSMGGKHRVLLRGELGAIAAGEFARLPASERFFAGGDRSVRGFGLNELGPRDEQGQVIGGRYLLVSSVEYERRVFGKWGFGVFADAGNAFDSLDGGIEAAVGIGLRRLTPIGMVRVDVAHPVTDGGDGIRVHFTFGPEL